MGDQVTVSKKSKKRKSAENCARIRREKRAMSLKKGTGDELCAVDKRLDNTMTYDDIIKNCIETLKQHSQRIIDNCTKTIIRCTDGRQAHFRLRINLLRLS